MIEIDAIFENTVMRVIFGRHDQFSIRVGGQKCNRYYKQTRVIFQRHLRKEDTIPVRSRLAMDATDTIPVRSRLAMYATNTKAFSEHLPTAEESKSTEEQNG